MLSNMSVTMTAVPPKALAGMCISFLVPTINHFIKGFIMSQQSPFLTPVEYLLGNHNSPKYQFLVSMISLSLLFISSLGTNFCI